MRKLMLSLVTLALTLTAGAASLPYDTTLDADAALRDALANAQAQHKHVLLIFGANWCQDCRQLDQALHGTSAPLIDAGYVVVKIDVGHFDKNLDVANRYGNPIQKGIPAAVVLSPQNRVLFATRAGELANARRMGEQGIYDYLASALPAPDQKRRTVN